MKRLLILSAVFALTSNGASAIKFVNENEQSREINVHGIEPRGGPSGDVTLDLHGTKSPKSTISIKFKKQIAKLIAKGETSLKVSYGAKGQKPQACIPDLALSTATSAKTLDSQTTVTITADDKCTVTTEK